MPIYGWHGAVGADPPKIPHLRKIVILTGFEEFEYAQKA
jgi:hypothetical protein